MSGADDRVRRTRDAALWDAVVPSSPVPASLLSRASATLVLVALHACTGAQQRAPAASVDAYDAYAVVAPDGDLERAAERFAGAACELPQDIAGRILGAADPQACGPFPCGHAGCFVKPCRSTSECIGIGFCSAGYCLAARPHGERACEPFREPSSGAGSTSIESLRPYYAGRAGCMCTPDGARARDPRACGSLPCSPEGCYVQRCDRDAECRYGLCSAHASWPHGYCVTDDPR